MGYGTWGTVDVEHPSDPPHVTVEGTLGSGSPVVTANDPRSAQGTFSYYSGVSGTVNVTASQHVVGIAAHCTVAGSMTIAGGSSIPIPANTSVSIVTDGQLVAPQIVFTGTDAYVITVIS